MFSYHSLRRHWIEELESRGETRRLRPQALGQLERGSLAVFAAMRLDEIGRQRRLACTLRGAAALALIVTVGASLWHEWGAALGARHFELPLPRKATVTVPLVGVCLLLAAWGHALCARARQRLAIYERLESAVERVSRLFSS